MKLRNKKTGDIAEVLTDTIPVNVLIGREDITGYYGSLAELNDEWEDYEEPEEEFWYIDSDCETYGVSRAFNQNDSDDVLFNKSIGNYFKTKEEAEKAVEKLKAWKRLKDANIDYKLTREYDDFTETMHANVCFSFNSYPLVGKDLDFLFGGEE